MLSRVSSDRLLSPHSSDVDSGVVAMQAAHPVRVLCIHDPIPLAVHTQEGLARVGHMAAGWAGQGRGKQGAVV